MIHCALTSHFLIKFVSLGSKFATGTPFIQQVGLSDFAMAGEDGVPVQEDKVVFPYKLVFRLG